MSRPGLTRTTDGLSPACNGRAAPPPQRERASKRGKSFSRATAPRADFTPGTHRRRAEFSKRGPSRDQASGHQDQREDRAKASAPIVTGLAFGLPGRPSRRLNQSSAGEQQRKAYIDQDVRCGTVDEVREEDDAICSRSRDRRDSNAVAPRTKPGVKRSNRPRRNGEMQVARAHREPRRPTCEVVGDVADIAQHEGLQVHQILAPRQETRRWRCSVSDGEQQVRSHARPRRPARPGGPASADVAAGGASASTASISARVAAV